jgi:CHAT domain-containing protein
MVIGIITVAPLLAIRAQNIPPPVPVLRPGGELRLRMPVERTSAGGQSDSFTVHCPAGDFLHVVAEQKGVDIVLSILDPSGKLSMRADSPNGTEGPEFASAICTAPGTYRVNVSALDPKATAGSYSVQLEALRRLRLGDRDEVTAETQFFKAVALNGANPESPQTATELLRCANLLRSWTGSDTERSLLLTYLGDMQMDRMQAAAALQAYAEALSLTRRVGDPGRSAVLLTIMGAASGNLGRLTEAIDSFRQAIAAAHQAADAAREAEAWRMMGIYYHRFDDDGRALEAFMQALPIARKTGQKNNIGIILEDLAYLEFKANRLDSAQQHLEEDLQLARSVANTDAQADAIWQLGLVAEARGNPQLALMDELAARKLQGESSHTSLGMIDASLMDHFAVSHPEQAIFFGQEAVYQFQLVRKHNAASDAAKVLDAFLVRQASPYYRTLADLLVQQGRLADAELVLDLLKSAELKEAVRGASDLPSTRTVPLPVSGVDHATEANVDAASATAAGLADASFEFDRLSALPSRSDAETAKMKALSAQIAAGNAAIESFFNKTLYAELGNNAQSNARVNTADEETSSMGNLLANLGPGTLALYTLIGDQHSYVIVTTANTRTRYEIDANAAELGKLVLAVRQQLHSADGEPSADLEKLNHLIMDPIAADVASAARQSPDGIPTLLWSLDGVLRYIPLGALLDSKLPPDRRYLVQRARNVVITPESRDHLLDRPAAGLHAAALGVSQSYNHMPALRGVTDELTAVVRDPAMPASHGPMDGTLLEDDAFTLASFEDALRLRPSVVHIASHFVFRGDVGESFLLLSDGKSDHQGYELTASQLLTDPLLSVRGARLVTLSACSTAEAGTLSNGRDMDSLGMILQKRGAAAVLATLWSVNDTSTSLLMSDFYRRWATTPGIQKVEALRQAQLAMLGGKLQPAGATYDLSHPYYWAPFVLIGNFR